MIFNSKNRDDIFRYFKGTYVKFRENGDELFYISNVDQWKVTGKHESGQDFVLYLNDETPYDAEYVLPHKSFFQYGQHAVQLLRVPAKQYYRGLCASNTNLLYFDAGQCRQLELSFDVLKAYVKKQHFLSLKQALESNGTMKSVAMSPRMMVMPGNGTLYVDFTPVAKVSKTKQLVTVQKPIFFDEVEDLLKQHGDVGVFGGWKLESVPPPPPPPALTAEQKAAAAKKAEEDVKLAAFKATLKKKHNPLPAQFILQGDDGLQVEAE